MSAAYDPSANSAACYHLAIRAQREIGIREGRIQPDPERPHELAWAKAGPVRVQDLDTAKGEARP